MSKIELICLIIVSIGRPELRDVYAGCEGDRTVGGREREVLRGN